MKTNSSDDLFLLYSKNILIFNSYDGNEIGYLLIMLAEYYDKLTIVPTESIITNSVTLRNDFMGLSSQLEINNSKLIEPIKQLISEYLLIMQPQLDQPYPILFKELTFVEKIESIF
jgi:hypothetical protein